MRPKKIASFTTFSLSSTSTMDKVIQEFHNNFGNDATLVPRDGREFGTVSSTSSHPPKLIPLQAHSRARLALFSLWWKWCACGLSRCLWTASRLLRNRYRKGGDAEEGLLCAWLWVQFRGDQVLLPRVYRDEGTWCTGEPVHFIHVVPCSDNETL